jgi:PAT family beta-lactamase induction signal transducer AmpG
MAGAIGFENFASGLGGVAVIAYFSALCDLRYTAAQFALMTAAMSVVGRIVTGATAGMLIERLGFVNFYLLTTVIAFPGIVVFWLMVRTGYLESSLGTVVTATANRGRGTQV